jgi:hypothetical protein
VLLETVSTKVVGVSDATAGARGVLREELSVIRCAAGRAATQPRRRAGLLKWAGTYRLSDYCGAGRLFWMLLICCWLLRKPSGSVVFWTVPPFWLARAAVPFM